MRPSVDADFGAIVFKNRANVIRLRQSLASQRKGHRMPRPPFYSSSRQPLRTLPAPYTDAGAQAAVSAAPPQAAAAAGMQPASRQSFYALWAAVLILATLLAISVWQQQQRPSAHPITQEDIDAAVLRSLQTITPPATAAHAFEAIEPSVVRVVGYGRSKNRKQEIERGIGTGVVIVSSGVILTNLHVVAGADRIGITFSDGTETTASLTSSKTEYDLAVLRAHSVPDDLQAATLGSTHNLRPGDPVVAVGFPFGIGPSASAGVVSGLDREFTSPRGKQELSQLIQFDAAANPGNSGGPLVNLEGEVVGIVTAILNPTQAHTFIGIGFAIPIESAVSATGVPPF